jgi:hypothetical protein
MLRPVPFSVRSSISGSLVYCQGQSPVSYAGRSVPPSLGLIPSHLPPNDHKELSGPRNQAAAGQSRCSIGHNPTTDERRG